MVCHPLLQIAVLDMLNALSSFRTIEL
jgi:hypothetical protein